MADKYVDFSLAPGGTHDGTTPATAWITLEEVLRNTMAAGSYAAGDHIHIRTHDGTSDITETMTTGSYSGNYNIAGTDINPLIFIADAGVKWPGDSGTFKLLRTVDNNWFTFVEGAIFQGTNFNFQFQGALTGYGRAWKFQAAANAGIEFNGVNFLATASNTISQMQFLGPFSLTTFNNCKFELSSTLNLIYAPLSFLGQSARVVLNNCTFNMSNIKLDYSISYMASQSYGSQLVFNGGKVLNALPTQGIFYAEAPTSSGSQATRTLIINSTDISTMQPAIGSFADVFDSLKYGNCRDETFYSSVDTSIFYVLGTSEVAWLATGNFPVLNSILPDSGSTPYSFRVKPGVNTSELSPATLNNIKKFWNASAGVVKITAFLLIKDTSGGGSGAFDAVNADSCYMDVMYKDNVSGDIVVETTKADVALTAAPTANWSSTSYGAASYNKFKLELTTDNAVASDTLIDVKVKFGLPLVADDDFFFVDPDVLLEAV